MQSKDFSILFEKIPATTEKTDIAMVSGYNSVVQKINHLFNTNKGEMVSDKYFGSDLYVYLFDPVGEKAVLEANLSNYIQSSITGLIKVIVTLISYAESLIKFKVSFSYFDGLKIYDNVTCFIEVIP